MSLNYNLSNIKDQTIVCWEKGTMNPVTKTIIFQMMAIDMNSITEKNVPEIMFRLRYWSKVFGKPIQRIVDGSLEDHDITKEEVVQHIGLSTNVFQRTRSQFMSKLRDSLAWIVKDDLADEDRRREEKQ